MKDEINLLPPSVQQARLRRLFRKRFAYLGRRCLVAMVLLWVVLGVAAWWVLREEQSVRRELARHVDGASSAETEVGFINETVEVVNRRVGEHPVWLPYLKDVVQVLPGEARFEVLGLTSNGELMVRGVSSSRTAVLDMERALKALPWVERVDAPLQNFAVGGKGEFSFTLIRKGRQDD